LPVGWDAIPEGRVSVDVGSAWLNAAASALACVPSVVVPEEFNILVNPKHPDAASIRARKVRRWLYDGRLRGA
jgi:RES domain-containing protein